MATVEMTARWLERLKPPAAGRDEYLDEKVSGLGLRVSFTGRMVWYVVFRVKGDSKLRRLTLDPFPALGLADARDEGRRVLLAASRGEDPASQKQDAKAAPDFAELAAEYLERHAKKVKRSWQEDERVIGRDLLPAWGRRKAHEITRRDVIKLLDAIADRGAPIQANRTRALISKIFNWAIGRDLVVVNPCNQVRAVAPENQSDRVLTEDEIRAVWRSFGELEPLMAAIFKLRLLTAQRGGEVGAMRWADLDLASGWWTIPGEVAKNGLSHRVPLSAPSIALLQPLRDAAKRRAKQAGKSEKDAENAVQEAWVFPSPRGQGARHIANVQKAADRVKASADVAFVPHDLRRTAASYMTGMGISRLVVSKILNHVEQGITRVYDRHSYDAEKRQALDAWGERLTAIVEVAHV